MTLVLLAASNHQSDVDEWPLGLWMKVDPPGKSARLVLGTGSPRSVWMPRTKSTREDIFPIFGPTEWAFLYYSGRYPANM